MRLILFHFPLSKKLINVTTAINICFPWLFTSPTLSPTNDEFSVDKSIIAESTLRTVEATWGVARHCLWRLLNSPCGVWPAPPSSTCAVQSEYWPQERILSWDSLLLGWRTKHEQSCRSTTMFPANVEGTPRALRPAATKARPTWSVPTLRRRWSWLEKPKSSRLWTRAMWRRTTRWTRSNVPSNPPQVDHLEWSTHYQQVALPAPRQAPSTTTSATLRPWTTRSQPSRGESRTSQTQTLGDLNTDPRGVMCQRGARDRVSRGKRSN